MKCLTLALLTTLVLAVVTVRSWPRVILVEVKIRGAGGEEVKSFLLDESSSSSLTLPVPADAREMVIRVDSSSPLKPCSISLDGIDVVPCYEEGVVLIEDFVWINFSKLDRRPRTVTVRFSYGQPKPPIYTLHDRGETVWGYVIEALCSDGNVLSNLSGSKVTVLSRKLLRVPTSMGEVSLWDVVVLQTGGEPGPLLEAIRRASVEVRVKTLYYSTLGSAQSLYLYVNQPAVCTVRVDALSKADDVIGRAFPGHPALYVPNTTASLGSCDIVVVNSGPFDYTISGVLVPAGSRREVALTPNALIRAEAYRGGVKVYTLTIHGLPRVLELPSYAYRVGVNVVDNGGDLVSDATVIITGANNSLKEACRLKGGFCLFSTIPPGLYVVTVYVGDREVGRTTIVVGRSDETVTLKADLNDFEVVVLYPVGERMAGYTVLLQASDLKYEARESQGRAVFNDVPSGSYSFTVVKDGVTLARGALRVEAHRASYAIIANVSRVHLRVVDFLGRPLPRICVRVIGGVSISGCTDEKGVLTFDLPFGEYEVEAEGVGLRKHVNVRSGGEYLVLSTGVPPHFLIAAVIAAAIIGALKGFRGKREAEVEVLDLEGD